MTPPDALQHNVYWAWPGAILARSAVRQLFTKSAAPGPVTPALPRCDTSKMPTVVRTAVCSATTPPPAYEIGMSQPPKAPMVAPSARCASCNGECRSSADGVSVDMPEDRSAKRRRAAATVHEQTRQ